MKMGAALRVLGNCTSASILLSADILVTLISAGSRGLARLVDSMCGSGYNTPWRRVPWHEQRYSTAPVYVPDGVGYGGEMDVSATLKNSKYPIGPVELIEKAKEVLRSEFGTKAGCDDSCLAEDFQFVAPIIGPLSKTEFVRVFASFKVKDAIPDIKDNSWFQVDPLEPNRVWFFTRATGTHTGTLALGPGIAATGKSIMMPPQAQSMLFDEQGKCYTLTVGYTMDKRIGNTEGLGGVFGIVKAVGKPLPFQEAQRLYTPSLRFDGFEHLAKAVEAIGFDPNTRERLSKRD